MITLQTSTQVKVINLAKDKITNNLKSPQAQAEVYSVHIGKSSSNSKIAVTNNSLASKTKANILMRHVLFDQAKLSAKGLPQVSSSAQKCVTHLDQKTLLLSSQVKVISCPQLKIANNEVIASHSAAITRFNEEDFYYLQNRGLKQKEAKELLIEAFINEGLFLIEDNKISLRLFKTV
jgi:Fe-S cluster assembly protein SufD